MLSSQLKKYVSSYLSWSSITMLCAQQFSFVRNYIPEVIAQIHHDYLGGFDRQVLETYVIWLKRDIQLSTLCQQARTDLHKLLCDDSLISSEIASAFQGTQEQYPIAIAQCGHSPSHIIYLQKLLNTLHQSEQAFHEIEYFNIKRSQSDYELVSDALIKLPSLVDDLFQLVVLIDETPNNLEQFLANIKVQLMPKLQKELPKLNSLFTATKNNALVKIKANAAPFTSLLPNAPLSQYESRHLIIQSLFELSNIFDKFTNFITAEELPLSLLSQEQKTAKVHEAHQQLEQFIQATNGITTWFHYINCIKSIASLSGSLLNTSHRLTQSAVDNITKNIVIIEQLIPKGVHELAMLESNFHLSQGMLTKPATIYAEQYFILLKVYAKQVLALNQTLQQIKEPLQGTVGRGIQWLVSDPIPMETLSPSQSNISFNIPLTIQTHYFVQSRQSLLLQERATFERKLQNLEHAQQMLDSFFSRILNVKQHIEFLRSIQLTIRERLILAKQYKFFQVHVIKTCPEINNVIYKHLFVSAAERLKLIGECGLTLKNKTKLAKILKNSSKQAIEFINSLSYPKSTIELLCLAINDENCLSNEFINLIPLIPDNLAKDYLPWCWFDSLETQDVIQNSSAHKQPKETSLPSTWTDTFISSLSVMSMAMYGISVAVDSAYDAWDLYTVINAKNVVSASIQQAICDTGFSISQIDSQVESITSIKYDSEQLAQQKYERTLVNLKKTFSHADDELNDVLSQQTEKLQITTKQDPSYQALKNSIHELTKKQQSHKHSYTQQKDKIEQEMEQLVLPQPSNMHYEAIALPEDYKQLPLEQLKEHTSLYSTQAHLLVKQQKDINTFFTILEEEHIDSKATMSSLSTETIMSLRHLLFQTQTILNSTSSDETNYERIFIEALSPPLNKSIKSILFFKKDILKKVNTQLHQAQADKVLLEQCYTEKSHFFVEQSTFICTPLINELDSTSQPLFKTINNMKLDVKIKHLRTQAFPKTLKELLSEKLLISLDLDNINYSTDIYYQATQTEAIYMHMLNALYYLEESLKSFNNLQKLSESNNIVSRSIYLKTIIADLIVNVYNVYYYLTADHQHPKIQAIISEAMKIIAPLEDVPMISAYIADAKKSIQQKQGPLHSDASEKTDIIQSWQQQMRIIKEELGDIEFSINDKSRVDNSSPQQQNQIVINTSNEKEVFTNELSNKRKTLDHAYLLLEKALNKKSKTQSDNELEQSAKDKTDNTLAMIEKLSFTDPANTRNFIEEISNIITKASSAIFDEPSLKQVILELTEKSLNKLYRISDNTEISLGFKPNVLSDLATTHFFKWLNEFIKPVGLELDTSSMAHTQYLALSYNKRIYNLEKKIAKLELNTRKNQIKKEIFGDADDARDPRDARDASGFVSSPFGIIESLLEEDFSNTSEGEKNRTLFLKNYAKIQPYLAIIDSNYDQKLFLREHLRSSRDFNFACQKIKSLQSKIHIYINTINRENRQEISLCKEHITHLKNERKLNISKLFSIAKQYKLSFEDKLLNGKLYRHPAHNSMIARVHREYLKKYNAELNNHSGEDTHQEAFLYRLHDIENEKNKAFELYEIGSDMLKIFQLLSNQVKHDSIKNQDQYLIEKIKTLNNLQMNLEIVLFKSPDLTVVQQEEQLKEIYQQFENSAPELTKFTDNTVVKFIYDCLIWLSQRLENTTIQKFADSCFIKASDKKFSLEINKNTNHDHKLFKFFRPKAYEVAAKDAAELSIRQLPKNIS